MQHAKQRNKKHQEYMPHKAKTSQQKYLGGGPDSVKGFKSAVIHIYSKN